MSTKLDISTLYLEHICAYSWHHTTNTQQPFGGRTMTTATATRTRHEHTTDLIDTLKDHHRHSHTHRADMLVALGQLDEADIATQRGENSTATWLKRELNLPTATAYEYVSIARGLRRFRQLYDTFRSGVMPYSTMRLLLRYMHEHNEETLIDLALIHGFSELQHILAGADPADDTEPAEPSVTARFRTDGMLDFRALLPAVRGQALLAALKIAQLASYSDKLPDSDVLDDPEALDELIAHAETQPETCPADHTDTPAPPRTKLDMESILRPPSRYGPPEKKDLYPAFIAMMDMVRDNPTSPLRTPGAHVNIVLTEDGGAWMPENISARSAEVRSYIANATVRMHLLDKKGLTINVGRAQRFATDAQVLALLTAWGHQCAMPGCSHRRFIEIHHIQEWEDGGATNMDNLIPLCSSCHSKISHGTAYIQAHGPDLYFRLQDGTQYVSRNRSLPTRTYNHQGPLRDTVAPGDSFDERAGA